MTNHLVSFMGSTALLSSFAIVERLLFPELDLFTRYVLALIMSFGICGLLAMLVIGVAKSADRR